MSIEPLGTNINGNWIKNNYFHLRKWIWKWCSHNGYHFAHASFSLVTYRVYPIKYPHGSVVFVLSYFITLYWFMIDLPIVFRVTSLTLGNHMKMQPQKCHPLCLSFNVSTLLLPRQKHFNSSPPGQNDQYFADDMLRCIFVNENIKISLEVCSWGSNWQWPSIGFGNALAPNRRQAISWVNADPIHWCIYVALGGD